MIFKQVPVWSHSISEAAMRSLGPRRLVERWALEIQRGEQSLEPAGTKPYTDVGACGGIRCNKCHLTGREWSEWFRMDTVSDFTPGKCLRDWQSPKFIQVPDCGDPGFGHRDSKPTTYICGHVHLYLPRWSIISFLYPFCTVCFLYCLPLHLSNICQNLCILSAWSLRAFFHIESGPGSPFISKQLSCSQVFSAHLDPRIFD